MAGSLATRKRPCVELTRTAMGNANPNNVEPDDSASASDLELDLVRYFIPDGN